METIVINHIRKTINNNSLKLFLETLMLSTVINEKLLCFCILIEIKYGLLNESDYTNIINNINPSLEVNYENFTKKILVMFNNKYSNKTRSSRVVSLPIFKSFIGSFKNNRLKIDRKKIEVDYGWSGKNGVVWITPQEDLGIIIENSKDKEFPADDVCDYVGFARTEDYSDTREPSLPYLEFIAINYSDNFNDDVYQPNSSNADWANDFILFISYKLLDGFGRTYNETGLAFAKEQVHRKSYYYDDDFNVKYIGKMSVDECNRIRILQEAFDRLKI